MGILALGADTAIVRNSTISYSGYTTSLAPLIPDSTASPFHANTGKVGFKTGTAKAEVTLAVKTWQKEELPNLGFLIYATDETTASLQPKNLSDGGVAELEIFYTPETK